MVKGSSGYANPVSPITRLRWGQLRQDPADPRIFSGIASTMRWRLTSNASQLGGEALAVSDADLVRDGAFGGELRAVVLGEKTVAAQQFGQGPGLGDRPVAQHYDAV